MDKKEIIDNEIIELQGAGKKKNINGNITDRFVHLAYIKAWQLQRDKTNLLIKKMGERKKKETENEYFYIILSYLVKICTRISVLISGFTDLDSDCVSTDLLYRMGERGGWKRIPSNENITGEITGVKWFLNRQNPAVKKVLDGELPKFYEAGQTGGDKALFCINLDLKKEGKKYLNACLVISGPGGCFDELEKQFAECGWTFEEVLSDFLMPYFYTLIQGELASLYLWKKRGPLKSSKKEE